MAVDPGRLRETCRRWMIAELDVFGSVARGESGPDSDVDLLVTFLPGAAWGLLDHVAMEDDLSALFHELLVIGEAPKRLSTSFRDENPSIPWRQIAGMRDKLIHAYDAVDLGEVWRTATVDVPAVAVALRSRNPS